MKKTFAAAVLAALMLLCFFASPVLAEWEFTIEKADPTADMFTFYGFPAVYDGNPYRATLIGPEGIGEITLHYFEAGTAEELPGLPVNAGLYYVTADVAEAENYNAATGLSDPDWSFVIRKASPVVSEFTFIAPDTVCDGSPKDAIILFDGFTVGMGNISLKYRASGEEIWTREAPAEPGTYFVAVDADEGVNYTAAETLTSDSWQFTLEAPESDYEIIAGAASEWVAGGDGTLLFTSSAPFAKFVSVAVDGETVPGTEYDAEEGSTRILLKASFLNTLAEGEHSLKILSSDGEAETVFSVLIPDDTLPDAGDARLALWLGLLAVSGAALALTGKRRKRV